MTKTTHYGSGWETQVGKEIELPRDADNSYPFTHGSLATEIAEASFTASKISSSEPGTGDVVIQLTLDAHSTQWDLDTDEQGIIFFSDSDTDNLRRASNETSLEYTIKLILNDGDEIPVEMGSVSILPTVDDTGGTAQYLSRATRTGLESQLTAMLSGFKTTALSAAAVSGATSLTVNSSADFAVGNVINVITDSGFDQRTITSIADATSMAFSTGLTYAAASGNLVLKVY